jgi:hypothetical protein
MTTIASQTTNNRQAAYAVEIYPVSAILPSLYNVELLRFQSAEHGLHVETAPLVLNRSLPVAHTWQHVLAHIHRERGDLAALKAATLLAVAFGCHQAGQLCFSMTPKNLHSSQTAR